MLVSKNNLLDIMILKGWSLSELSRQSGVSYKTVWLMKSKHAVKPYIAKKIADALGVKVHEVFEIEQGNH